MARWSLLFIAMLLATQGRTSQRGEVAIIVHPRNPVSELETTELVKILKLEKQYWSGGKRIYLIMQESGCWEKDLLLRKVYHMSDRELKRYWLGRIFRGEIPEFPKALGSSEAVKRFVSQAHNAIGFVASSAVDASVKVVRIDGKPPGARDYFLHGGPS